MQTHGWPLSLVRWRPARVWQLHCVLVGLTVSTVFLITTCFITLVMVLDWRLSALLVAPFFLVLAFIEGAFISANTLKVLEGKP